MPDEDPLQLIGHETCVAPRLRVAHPVGLLQDFLVFLPSLRREVVLVFLHLTAADLQEVVDGEVLELEAIGEA